MHEGVLLEDLTFNRDQFKGMQVVGTAALQHVDREYGTGYPTFRKGRHTLGYHNGHHSRQTASDAVIFGEDQGCTRTELAVIKSAAEAHDFVQRKDRGVMEKESADWYKREARRRGVPEAAVAAGGLTIIGTEPILKGGRLVGQMVSRLRFPSKAAERAAMSVACGDMAEAFSPMGPYFGHQLGEEYGHSIEKFEGHLAMQLDIAQNFRFAHPRAEKLFARLRGEIAAYHERVLRDYQAGNIESLDALLQRDIAFARSLR